VNNDDENSVDKINDELLQELRKYPNYNPDLGTPKDPHYNSYKDFCEEIKDSFIMTIDPKNLMN